MWHYLLLQTVRSHEKKTVFRTLVECEHKDDDRKRKNWGKIVAEVNR